MPIKLGIVGSRDYTDWVVFTKEVKRIIAENKWDVDTVVSGGAKGVDSMAATWARIKKLGLIEHKPDYKKYHPKQAPKERNTLIVRDSDVLIAFWHFKEEGGTWDSIQKARAKKIPIEYVNITQATNS